MEDELRAGFDVLVGRLRAEGFDAGSDPRGVRLGIGNAVLLGKQVELRAAPDGRTHSVILWLGVRLMEGRPPLFLDLATGRGPTPGDAAAVALLAWRDGVLPPLLPLLGEPAPEGVAVLADEDGIPPWVVYAGPPQCTGPRHSELAGALAADPPLRSVRDVPRRTSDPRSAHWLKLFRLRDDEAGIDQADCFLDSEPSDLGAACLQRAAWPALPGRHTYRQFFTLIPAG